jgi:YD repeat-containing protein
VQYDLAGRMTGLTRYHSAAGLGICSFPSDNLLSEGMSYNVNGQLVTKAFSVYDTFSWCGTAFSGSPSYSFSPSANNGQITQVSDTMSGETVVYGYDALNRLISAASTPIAGGTPAAWTQTYQYDGFGNLTGKVLNGTTASIPVDSSTNRLTSSYDANGNMLSGAGVTLRSLLRYGPPSLL